MVSPKSTANDGYSAICTNPRCHARHGEKLTGPRELRLTLCPRCASFARRAKNRSMVNRSKEPCEYDADFIDQTRGL